MRFTIRTALIALSSITFTTFIACGTGVGSVVPQNGPNLGGNNGNTNSNTGNLVTLADSLWVTNGAVKALAASESTIYVGGSFTSIGKFVGDGAIVDTTSGALPSGVSAALIDGAVLASAPAADGGFYIGGNFLHVGGVARSHLAKLKADGSLDTDFQASTDNTVSAIAVSGSSVYVGGIFSQLNGSAQSLLGAVDASTGASLSWAPTVVGTSINALLVSGSTVYIGGLFSSVNGDGRYCVMAVDASTGTNLSFNAGMVAGTVYALALDGSTLYVGGSLTAGGGQSLNGIFAVASNDGSFVSAFGAPVLQSTVAILPGFPGISVPGSVAALAAGGGRVYVGGSFSSVNSAAHANLVALSEADGSLQTWADADGGVSALSLNGSTISIGGAFTHVAGTTARAHAAAIGSDGTVRTWAPETGGAVSTLAVAGSEVFLGGLIGSVGGVPRGGLAAIDIASGEATDWNPGLTGTVSALAIHSEKLYVGGSFTNSGSTRHNAAAFELGSGALTGWAPEPDAVVAAIQAAGDKVYLGGSFAHVSAAARAAVARVDDTNGAPDAWDAAAQGVPGIIIIPGMPAFGAIPAAVSALLLEDDRLVVGGSYASVGGGSANGNLQAVDLSTGAVASGWVSPGANGAVVSIAKLGSTIYLAGSFTSLGSTIRNTLAAVDGTTGAIAAWNPAPLGLLMPPITLPPIESLIFTDGTSLYAAGTFTSIGGQNIQGLAKLATDGTADASFNPQPDQMLTAAVMVSNHLVVGGAMTQIGGVPVPNLALLNADGTVRY